MRLIQLRLFHKALPILFFSVACVCGSAAASDSKTFYNQSKPSAKQIGFRVAPPAVTANVNQNSINPYGGNQRVINQAPVVIQGNPGNVSTALSRAPSAPAPSLATEPVVEGFGDKVPLTVAIQQILPQGYGYTLGDGVDPGQLVSWRGGRPWNVVLQEMLGPSSLAYSVNGRSVAISGTGASPTIVTGVSPVAPQAAIQAPAQPMMMQPMPQSPVVMQQQPLMMQPAPQTVVTQPAMQPMMMQQSVMMQPVPQGQMVMQQPSIMPAPEMQVAAGGLQPLQIENPIMFQSQTWEARPGQTLRTLLQEWCTRVGTELNWTAEFDYPIMASMNMTGTFEEAVRVLLTGFDAAKPTPRGRLHYNPAAGQSILVVEADGNHYGD